MPRFIIELLPPEINCPHCRASLSLDDEERTVKRFKCPACKKKIDLRVQMPELPAGKPASPFAKIRSSEIPLKQVPPPVFPAPAQAHPGAAPHRGPIPPQKFGKA